MYFFLLLIRPPHRSTLFPYTTLFRSLQHDEPADVALRLLLHLDRHERVDRAVGGRDRLDVPDRDRKSTRLNSSHVAISYAVFCLKKKKQTTDSTATAAHQTVM